VNPNDLQQRRQQIDDLDAEIVGLLHQRARLAQQIGALKDASARGIYAPDRERQVIERVAALAEQGPLHADHLVAIYRQVISACRALERTMRVAYFGPRATFTHQAALERFGEATDLVPLETIPDVFTEVQRGSADFGVVPVENSTDGPVIVTLDALFETELKVCSEIILPISLQLLARIPREEIRTLYTNPVAFGQCRQWVARNLPGVSVVNVVSTARAAIMATEEPSSAAIAPMLCATEYGLDVLNQDIQDLSSNFTRFYVMAHSATSNPTGRDKTAVIISIRDRPGALYDLLGIFASRGINLSTIHSRPSRLRAWDYVFFMEFGAHEKDAAVQEALAEIADQSTSVKVLGSWPEEPSFVAGARPA
jgi:chorismate mutase/prephenate dehydratase